MLPSAYKTLARTSRAKDGRILHLPHQGRSGLGLLDELYGVADGQDRVSCVVGDFNASEHSIVYMRLTEHRLRSAHDDRGRGYATTWPNGEYWCPPIRIDHAFVSPEIEVERIVEGRGRGSDHKPLIVDLRLRSAG